MVRPFLRARATIITALLGAFLAPATQAADMPFPVEEPPPAMEGPVEWGSNWYLRGDIGAVRTYPTQLSGASLSNNFPNNWTIGLGGGYQFNQYFRGDVTVDYEPIYRKTGVAYDAMLACQVGAAPILNAGGAIIGSLPLTSPCVPWAHNRTESMVALANAYIDLGNWWGFTPYVGAGVGVNVLYQLDNVAWYKNAATAYAGTTWTDPFTQVTYIRNWDHSREGTYVRLAYALMGGVSYDIDNHWKVDIGYRYANLGKITGFNQYNQITTRNLFSNQLRVGFRYMID